LQAGGAAIIASHLPLSLTATVHELVMQPPPYNDAALNSQVGMKAVT
jgi:hypothetical protein